MKKLMVIASLIFCSQSMAATEILTVQATPSLKSFTGSSVTFAFDLSEKVPEICARRLERGVSVDFQPSYQLLKKMIKNNETVSLTLRHTLEIDDDFPFEQCLFDSIKL